MNLFCRKCTFPIHGKHPERAYNRPDKLSATGEFHQNQARNDKHRCADPHRADLFAKKHDADHERTDRTDAGPDCISGAQRQAAHGDRQQPETGDHADDRDHSRGEPGEACGLLHGHGPDDFQQAGEQQMDPGHDGPPLGRARPSWSLGPDVGEVVPPGRHSSNGGAPRPPLPGTGYSRFSA
ncbi:hypothetical protein G6F57_015187 [Rhizopus arrhizus]|nr:hypothetical protein G6F68_011666 [Rhizopus microsporus]KAG1257748.1 hypothetical protein G6F65_015798 [Rhizopus arrhizus]KAG1456031.1 hypothetical protein G6F57_015187 [Rhizopus arrhizus]